MLVGEESLVQPCVDSYRARYREMAASETIVVPGIREILDGLANQLPLLVATSKPRALAEPLLDALNLRRFFAAVIGPELDSENEQKAITVGRAMRELSPKARPVMVGDRKHDIAAAHEHDIRAIGVLWGIGSEAELLAAGADALVSTPAELADLLTHRRHGPPHQPPHHVDDGERNQGALDAGADRRDQRGCIASVAVEAISRNTFSIASNRPPRLAKNGTICQSRQGVASPCPGERSRVARPASVKNPP